MSQCHCCYFSKHTLQHCFDSMIKLPNLWQDHETFPFTTNGAFIWPSSCQSAILPQMDGRLFCCCLLQIYFPQVTYLSTSSRLPSIFTALLPKSFAGVELKLITVDIMPINSLQNGPFLWNLFSDSPDIYLPSHSTTGSQVTDTSHRHINYKPISIPN